MNIGLDCKGSLFALATQSADCDEPTRGNDRAGAYGQIEHSLAPLTVRLEQVPGHAVMQVCMSGKRCGRHLHPWFCDRQVNTGNPDDPGPQNQGAIYARQPRLVKSKNQSAVACTSREPRRLWATELQ